MLLFTYTLTRAHTRVLLLPVTRADVSVRMRAAAGQRRVNTSSAASLPACGPARESRPPPPPRNLRPLKCEGANCIERRRGAFSAGVADLGLAGAHEWPALTGQVATEPVKEANSGVILAIFN